MRISGRFFSEVGGRVTPYHSMQEMEWNRTGGNEYFNGPKSGWIKCLEAKFGPEYARTKDMYN